MRERLSLRPLLRVTPRIALLSVAATAAMIAVTYVAFPLLVRWIPSLGTETQVIYARFIAGRTLAVLIAGVVPVVIAEELLWRGWFQGSLAGAGVLVAAVIYGAAHAPSGSMLLVVVALVCGLYWSALRAISGSMIPALCAHRGARFGRCRKVRHDRRGRGSAERAEEIAAADGHAPPPASS